MTGFKGVIFGLIAAFFSLSARAHDAGEIQSHEGLTATIMDDEQFASLTQEEFDAKIHDYLSEFERKENLDLSPHAREELFFMIKAQTKEVTGK